VSDPVTELAAFFACKTTVPDTNLDRLTSGARAAGHRWMAIAAACGITTAHDTGGVISQPGGASMATPAELLFIGAQHATEKLTGSRDRAKQIMAGLAHHYWPPDAAQLPWVTNAYPT
jgi:hypothetical protein